MPDFIIRLKGSTTSLFGLPPSLSDLDPDEKRILYYAAAFALGVFWLSVALVDPLLLLALPAVAVLTGAIVKRRRAAEPDKPDDDWTY